MKCSAVERKISLAAVKRRSISIHPKGSKCQEWSSEQWSDSESESESSDSSYSMGSETTEAEYQKSFPRSRVHF